MKFPKLEKISSNRSFGLLFFIVFLLIALWSFREDINQIKIWPLTVSIIFLILGLSNSKILTPFNKSWHYLGLLIGMVVSPVVMGIIYFLLISPMGIFMRFIGKDLLKLRMDKTTSYWINKDRSKSTMRNQF
tara:strand:+ start:67 stop:462 length:396 start_codon:yes stop_codon:yes gene_type:complete